jgi:hypothetical protein
MLLPFKMGVGGVVGSGKQWMSWISLDDHVAVINYVIENDNIRGAVNAVSDAYGRDGRRPAAHQHEGPAEAAFRCGL